MNVYAYPAPSRAMVRYGACCFRDVPGPRGPMEEGGGKLPEFGLEFIVWSETPMHPEGVRRILRYRYTNILMCLHTNKMLKRIRVYSYTHIPIYFYSHTILYMYIYIDTYERLKKRPTIKVNNRFRPPETYV